LLTLTERLAAVWRDLLRAFFNVPVHYLYNYSSTTSTAAIRDAIPVDASEAWAAGTTVLTIFGSGRILRFRPADNVYEVQLPYGVGYVKPSAIIGAEELSVQAIEAIGVTREGDSEVICGVPVTKPTSAASRAALLPQPNTVFFGTQVCYLFFRMYHTLYSRLSAARQLSAEQTARYRDGSAGRTHHLAHIDAHDEEGDMIKVAP
jgi:C-terminal domain of Sin3a protein